LFFEMQVAFIAVGVFMDCVVVHLALFCIFCSESLRSLCHLLHVVEAQCLVISIAVQFV
jgi:hypothetical protein